MSGQQNDSNSRRGGQGTVQAGHLHGELVACKSIPLKSKRAIAAETCSARRIGQVHPHIVSIKQCEKTATHIQMYMELAMCDLHDFQGCTKSPRLGEAVYVREWGLQLADALRVSHSRGVAHRDVKPENVLLCPHPECESIYPPMQPPCVAGGCVSQVAVYQHRKAQLQELAGNAADTPHALRAFTAKLCDFGAALVNTGGPGAPAVGVTPRGTSRFCSPQVMSGLLNRGIAPGLTTLWAPVVHPDIVRTCAASYDAYAADVWSFGVTLFALAAGGEPFQAAGPQCVEFRAFVRATQPEALCDEVMCPLSDVWRTDSASSDTSAPWAWPSCFSPALVHLLGGCLRVREGERLSMEEVAAHPWFKNPAWTPLPAVGAVVGLAEEAPPRTPSPPPAPSTAPISPRKSNKWRVDQTSPTLHRGGCAAGLAAVTPVPPARMQHAVSGSHSDDAFLVQRRSARLAMLGSGNDGLHKLAQGGSELAEGGVHRGRKLVPSSFRHMHGGNSGSSETGPRILLQQSLRGSLEQDPSSLDTLGATLQEIAEHGSREMSESNDVALA